MINNHRTVRTCAGIGDSIWLIQKLVNAKEKLNFLIPDGKPQRGHQIFELIPDMAASCQYAHFSFAEIKKYNRGKGRRWSDIQETEFFLEANTHLESGRKLEEFLPDLWLSRHIDWKIDRYEDAAKKLIPFKPKTKYIGIYTSSYSTARNWGFWEVEGWLKLISMIHKERKNYQFVIIGADWDTDVSNELIQVLQQRKIKNIPVISQPLGLVCQVMKRLDYGFYFPSGLPILSETIKGASDLTMFFPDKLAPMMGTFSDPDRKESGALKECLFCSPEDIYQWWCDVYQGYDRLEQTRGIL